MSFKIILTPYFKKEARKLTKKYKSLKTELNELDKLLSTNPTHGTYLGNNVYKIRLAIKSKGKGKRGGGRVITLVEIVDKEVYMLTIYSKGEKDDITNEEIQYLVDKIDKSK